MKSLTDFLAVLIFLTFSVLTVLLVSFMRRVVYTSASRCTLVVLLILTVYCIRKSKLDTHLVIFFGLSSDTCFCTGFVEPLGHLVSCGSLWTGAAGGASRWGEAREAPSVLLLTS